MLGIESFDYFFGLFMLIMVPYIIGIAIITLFR